MVQLSFGGAGFRNHPHENPWQQTFPMTGELLPMEPSRWKEADGDDGAMEVEKKEEEEEKVKDTLVFELIA